MGVVVVCTVVVVAALVATFRWGGMAIESPWHGEAVTRRDALARYVWWVGLLLGTVVASGVTVIGAGGRLAMRLLAATGGDGAQGRLTEADEVVGEITVGGTIGFVVFVGLIGGLLTTAVFFAVRRWLPSGRLAGLLFGIGFFVVVATRSDPLRPENRDFDLVGPGWLSVLVFTALGIAQGLAIPAFAGRISASLPLPTSRPGRRHLLYAPLLLLVPIFPLGAGVLLGAIVVAVFGLEPLRALQRWWTSERVVWAGRALVAAVVLVATPSFVDAAADIVSRS